MKNVLILFAFTLFFVGCSSANYGPRQEEQAMDSFDYPVGYDSLIHEPYGGYRPR